MTELIDIKRTALDAALELFRTAGRSNANELVDTAKIIETYLRGEEPARDAGEDQAKAEAA